MSSANPFQYLDSLPRCPRCGSPHPQGIAGPAGINYICRACYHHYSDDVAAELRALGADDGQMHRALIQSAKAGSASQAYRRRAALQHFTSEREDRT